MKKVLIITYYWPPAGGPGVQRVLKFVKYLPKFGWEPVVLTVENGEYPALDKSLLNEVPDSLSIYKVQSFEPFSFYKKLSGRKGNLPTHILSKTEDENIVDKTAKWIRTNIFLPDARIGWYPNLVKKGKEIIKNENINIILSSSPPHSVQLGAKKIAAATNTKWIADFRDPWTDGFWQKFLPRTKLATYFDTNLEKSVIKKADHIITVSEGFKKLFSRKTTVDFTVITNGYDVSDFQNVHREQGNNFVITYTGSIRTSQIPNNLFKALQILKGKGLINNLRLQFIGSQHPKLEKIINDYGLSDITLSRNYVSHNVLMKYVLNSTILLVLVPDTKDNEGIIPAKLFEYIGSKNYVMGFGPKDSDVGNIINKCNCGSIHSFEENPHDIILELYSTWEKGFSLLKTPNDISEFLRENLAEKLSQTLIKVYES